MVNVPSLRCLRTFLLSDAHEAHHLLSMPAIYNVYNSSSPFEDFIEILRWIEDSTRSTINALVIEPPLEAPLEGITEGDWMEVWKISTSKSYDSRSVDRMLV